MRLSRVALIVLPVLVGAVLLAAWLLPPQLDWARYRSTIARVATNRLGLPVTIQGPVALTLLPEPVLTADAVNVGNRTAGTPVIRVEALRLRLAWLPLLTGRIDVRTLVLHRPDLHFTWPPRRNLALPQRPPAWLAAFAARIEDGTVSVGQFAITGIDGTLSGLPNGALQAAVAATIERQRWRIGATLSGAGPGNAAGLSIMMHGEGKAAGITAGFTGKLGRRGVLDGRVHADGPNLSVLLPTPALRFSAAGRLTVADGLAEADELAVQLDGTPATGAVSLLLLPHLQLDIALSATTLDLDPWARLLRAPPAEPGRLTVGMDVSADAATLAGATLQHLRATFDLRPGAVAVQEIAADLPGDAHLQVAGQIDRTEAAGPRFTGTAQLRAPVLRTTLDWLLPQAKPLLASLPAELAQRAVLAGDVSLQPNHVALSDLHGTFDDAPVNGSLDWKSGQPGAVTADLHFGRLRLDPWLSAAKGDATLRQTLLHRLNADMHLSVAHATIRGTPVSGLTLDASTAAGGVHLHRLKATVLKARLAASGSIGAAGQITDGTLQLTTDNAAPLAALLPVAWRGTPALWKGPATLAIQAAGPRKAVVGSVRLKLGNLRLHLHPTVDLDAESASGSVTLHDPNAMRFISALGLSAQLGLDGTPRWLGEGPLSLVAKADVAPGPRIALNDAELVAGRLRSHLHLTLDAGGKEPVVTGRISADTLPLPNLANATLPVELLHGWQATLQVTAGSVLSGDVTLLRNAGAAVRLQQSRLRLKQVSATLGGGSVSGTASLDAAQTPPALVVHVRIADAALDGSVFGLPVDVTSGLVSGSVSAQAAGYSMAALKASLSGSVSATVQKGAVSGFSLARLQKLLHAPSGASEPNSLRKAIESGSTPFQHLTLRAVISHGILSLEQADLSGASGTAQASGSVVLPGSTADLRIMLRPALPNGPEIGVQLNGALAAPDRTPELAALERWRSRHTK